MLDFVRTWLGERNQTTTYPHGGAALPQRFRGRPTVAAPAGRVLPVLDLGRLLFAPEEASADGSVTFTQDVAMASRTLGGLTSPTGVPELAIALDERMRRLLGRSLRLRAVSAGSCNGCEGELVALGNIVFDMARFGIQFVASPRHADGIVITGVVNANMRDALLATYDAVADPRIVIAVGACATGGGPFAGGPEVLGIPSSIPVDLWIPGCPPHPLTVLDGLLRLLGRIEDRSPR